MLIYATGAWCLTAALVFDTIPSKDPKMFAL